MQAPHSTQHCVAVRSGVGEGGGTGAAAHTEVCVVVYFRGSRGADPSSSSGRARACVRVHARARGCVCMCVRVRAAAPPAPNDCSATGTGGLGRGHTSTPVVAVWIAVPNRACYPYGQLACTGTVWPHTPRRQKRRLEQAPRKVRQPHIGSQGLRCVRHTCAHGAQSNHTPRVCVGVCTYTTRANPPTTVQPAKSYACASGGSAAQCACRRANPSAWPGPGNWSPPPWTSTPEVQP